MNEEPRYPIFHWVSGLAICTAFEAGFFVGLLVKVAL